MRAAAFSSRCAKEVLRDPLTLVFGVGLPVILLLFINLLSRSLPVEVSNFKIENFTPGMAVFSLTFLAMFSALLISGDRTSSFLARLFASPLTAGEYILGYSLPLIPIALAQGAVCFAFALVLGLDFTPRIFAAILALLPAALLNLSVGLLFGSVFTDKQTGGFFSMFVQVATLLSGTWFDLELIGGTFSKVCHALPFAHSVEAVRAALSGGALSELLVHICWVLGYAVVIFVIAIAVFKRKMRG